MTTASRQPLARNERLTSAAYCAIILLMKEVLNLKKESLI